MTIPRILHQTWKTDSIPEQFLAWSKSWEIHNPSWRRILWSDRMLLDFVAQYYPDLLSTYCSYKVGVQRADAARYMLLHHFGGVYADLDCECVAPFDDMLDENRIVLCKEPERHSDAQTKLRNLPYLLFNGTMASPKGHPFWQHLLAYLPVVKDAQDVLDATGPCLLTAAQLSFSDQAAFAIHPNSLFSPTDRHGASAEATSSTLSIHHWAGTWWIKPKPPSLLARLRRSYYQLRHELTKGAQLDVAAAQAAVDTTVINRPPPSGNNIAILVPLSDAADHIAPFFAALALIEHPKDCIKLVFCEGDSSDGSWERLSEATASLNGYRDIVLLKKDLGIKMERTKRWKLKLQRKRRSAIAAVRNHLISHGIDASDDWALWIDIDVWRYPSDVATRLIGSGSRIVVPNCTVVPGGGSFDLNSFATIRRQKDYRYYRAIRDGLYQPPAKENSRLYLSDLRHLDRVNLDGVGGTMLLVDAALHRGGLNFPEIPYKFLLETEGFAALANDLGIVPLGLPKIEVLHVPW
ncbi:glycosyltransferase [Aminobacter sp. UC22_36]|uniref:glycosyltransferase n=1 Tax=Aminobacter sp. UC22_36 TaxID=3374549 RepID=UPI0037572018